MKKLNLLLLILFSAKFLYGQTPCIDAQQFCSNTNYNVPCPVAVPSANPSYNYGCLFSNPNPMWYKFKVGVSGPIQIHANSYLGVCDIDGAMWGPFNDGISFCSYLNNSTPISCDYTGNNYVDFNITNAQVGEWYYFVLTNFSSQPSNIEIQQINTGGGFTVSCQNCSVDLPEISSGCIGSDVLLEAGILANSYVVNWVGPNGNSSNHVIDTLTNFSIQDTGLYIVNISGTNCNASDTTRLQMFDASFSVNQINGSTFQFEPNQYGATIFHWDFGDGSTDSSYSPIHSYTNTGNYMVCYSSVDGPCSDTTCTTLNVNLTNVGSVLSSRNIQIVQTSEDGIFKMVSKQKHNNLRFFVYNANGQMLFHSSVKTLNAFEEQSINLSNVKSGVYVIQVLEDKEVYNFKVFKN